MVFDVCNGVAEVVGPILVADCWPDGGSWDWSNRDTSRILSYRIRQYPEALERLREIARAPEREGEAV